MSHNDNKRYIEQNLQENEKKLYPYKELPFRDIEALEWDTVDGVLNQVFIDAKESLLVKLPLFNK